MRSMKKFIKFIALILTFAFILPCFSACDTNSLEGAHVFLFKMSGNKFGDLMYEGFSEVIKEYGGKSVYKCPADGTVAGQIEIMDTLIIQKVKSITISACGLVGYDQMFKKAREAGIKVISVDSSVSPKNRIIHVDPCSNEAIGSAIVQTATLIALGVPYPDDGDLETATKNALEGYSGKELKFGILSSAIDTASQNNWIAKMREEVNKDMYKGKVNPYMEVKYGNDDITEATTQANAFVSQGAVDVILTPTTVAMVAAGKAIQDFKSDIKVAGLGLPSEMQAFMPLNEEDDEFDYPCPYMLLWDVVELGAVTGAAMMSVFDEGYDGKENSTFTYKGKTYTTEKADDGGTKIVGLTPYVFHKGNMKDWINVL